MRHLISVFLFGIILASCGPQGGDSTTGDYGGSADVIGGDISSDLLSKEFTESGVDLNLSDFTENVRIYLIDAPVDAKSVKVTIAELGIHRSDPEGEWIRIDMDNQEFDLLQLRDGPSGILGDITLEPGHYNLLRLKVSAGEITLNSDETHSLCIPDNGRKNHIQLKIDLNIDEEHESEDAVDAALDSAASDEEMVDVEEDAYGVIVDFDALESIAEYETTDGDIDDATCTYVLRPKLKLNRAAKLLKKKRKLKRRGKKLREKLRRTKERLRRARDRQANKLDEKRGNVDPDEGSDGDRSYR